MSDLPNPHDRFFKELFSQLDTVADFDRHYLPESLVAAIDLATLEIVKESFVDEELRRAKNQLLKSVSQIFPQRRVRSPLRKDWTYSDR